MKIFVYRSTTGRKDGEVEAKAIIGPLAVHRKLPNDPYLEWVVTHIESGGVVISSGRLASAKSLAKDLAKLDWSEVKTRRSVKALAKLTAPRREILKKHGIV